jgi:glycerol-3-phosphate dehydrogenase
MQPQERRVDVIVIGGGVNGTGVARDLALRGLQVALFERNDLGFGASGNSSGMIHGGPRYLFGAPEVTHSSCLDSGYIQRIAPHLLFRVPFLMPVFGSGWRALKQLSEYDIFFTAYDAYQGLKRSKKHIRCNSEEVGELVPGLIPALGAVTFDEWGLDGVRLCVLNAVDARLHGAEIFVRHSVTEILRDGAGRAEGVRSVNHATGEQSLTRAGAIVNATGAWAAKSAKMSGLGEEALRVRPGKGVHVYLDRRLTNFAIVTEAVDGRQVFLLPWQNMSVLGTTDDDFYGDPDRVVATVDEVEYLHEAIARVFPAVRSARPIGTWAGLRPTLYAWGIPEDALSREHQIVHHDRDGLAHMYSMLGGKLASYRLFCQEMADLVASDLGRGSACSTHVQALPGGESEVQVGSIQAKTGVDALVERRLLARHGSRALALLESCGSPAAQNIVCPCEPVSEAEVRWVVREEWATDVEGVAHRTRLGLGPCGGQLCARRAASIIADERGQDAQAAERDAERFLAKQAERTAALGPWLARLGGAHGSADGSPAQKSGAE